MAKTRRTYQPSKTRRARSLGFRARIATVGGRSVIKNRRRKGRKLLSVTSGISTRVVKNKRLSRRRK